MNDPARQIHNIALVGFMGCGKTSTGYHLASLIGFEFLDTDAWIEAQTGLTVSQIFAQFGETEFRELETKVGNLLADRRKLVIATGGGFVMNPANLEQLQHHALIVCLWASPETLLERVRHQDHRPLLRDKDPLATIRTLLAEREPVYRKADVLINTEQRSTREIAQQIAHHFHSLQS